MSSFGDNGLKNKSENRLLAIPFPPRRSLQRIIAALCGATFASASSLAFSLGLGDMSSDSFLGQPLKAKIELISLEGDIDPQTLIVRQVTPDEAVKMGVDIFNIPYRIDFVVDSRGGAPQVTVTSREPVHEPYLSLLVELRWPKGVVYREYPLLLDPPPAVPVREVKTEPRRVIPQPTQSPRSTPASTRPTPVQMTLEPLQTEHGKYKVRPGDTLSKIAERWREGTSQSIGETAQWMFENNSHAFANNNMNRLMAGAVLQMPDLSAYRLDNSTPVAPSLAPLPQAGSGEGQAGTELTAVEPAEQSFNNRVGNDAVQSRDVRGLLTLGTESRDDKTRELIDLLVRENETLKARMEKLESSEYLDTLKQLIVLQRQQISDLREKLGVPDNDVTQEMDSLLGEIGVNVDSTKKADVSLSTPTSAPAPIENARTEAIIEVEPAVTPLAPEKESRNWLVWLLFGAAVALSALFIGMFSYYRRMVPGKQRSNLKGPEDYSVPVEDYRPRAEPTLAKFDSAEQAAPVEFDGELTPIYVNKKKDEENWIGEKVASSDVETGELDVTIREVQEAFEDLVLDEEILKSLDAEIEETIDSIPLVTEQESPDSSPAKIEPITAAESPKKKGKKDKAHPTRRPDEEVRLSIAEKMAQYNPDEYRREIENLGLLELDELSAIEENDEEDVETIVYRAMMFCEFKKFDKARELIESKMMVMSDDRLSAALEEIDNLQRDAQGGSKKAI